MINTFTVHDESSHLPPALTMPFTSEEEIHAKYRAIEEPLRARVSSLKEMLIKFKQEREQELLA